MMKLKLDENIDARLATLLRDAGHDALTIREQKLRGSTILILTSTGCAFPKTERS